MFCRNCGNEINETDAFCSKCGTQTKEKEVVAQNLETEKVEQPKGNGMAIAGFVCSFFIPLLGWIFGGIGLSRARKRNGKGLGFSIAALAIATVMFFVNMGIMM